MNKSANLQTYKKTKALPLSLSLSHKVSPPGSTAGLQREAKYPLPVATAGNKGYQKSRLGRIGGRSSVLFLPGGGCGSADAEILFPAGWGRGHQYQKPGLLLSFRSRELQRPCAVLPWGVWKVRLCYPQAGIKITYNGSPTVVFPLVGVEEAELRSFPVESRMSFCVRAERPCFRPVGAKTSLPGSLRAASVAFGSQCFASRRLKWNRGGEGLVGAPLPEAEVRHVRLSVWRQRSSAEL